MLLNPYTNRLTPVAGTRLVDADLGLVGAEIPDPLCERRVWTIQSIFVPISSRKLGGIRAKLTDSKDFVTFVNQRDLEVMLGIVEPGDWCKWAGTDYPDPGEPDWFGFCMDESDLLDDLWDREQALRSGYIGYGLPDNTEILRRIHTGENLDEEELLLLMQDFDESGYPSMGGLESRWTPIERVRCEWRKL